MKLKLFVLILYVFLATFLHAQFSETITWDKTIIDEGDVASGGIAVGSPYIGLTPSNQNYLYCASFGIDEDLVEYSFNQWGQWSKNIVIQGMGFEGITIGPGRDDSNERIYCFRNMELYEIWSENGIWNLNLLFQITESQFDYLIIGEGRNDEVNRIYVSNKRHVIFELSYIGPGHNDWNIEIIDQNMYCEDIGRCRSDGVNRIYGIGGDDEWIVYELTYDPMSDPPWNREEVWTQQYPFPSVCGGVSLGKMRIDNQHLHIYYLDVFTNINELIWKEYLWVHKIVEPLSPPPSVGSYGSGLQAYGRPFAFGLLGNHDPPLYLLFINRNNIIYSFIYNKGKWQRDSIGEIYGYGFVDLEFGDVRSKENFSLFVVSFYGKLLEFYTK